MDNVNSTNTLENIQHTADCDFTITLHSPSRILRVHPSEELQLCTCHYHERLMDYWKARAEKAESEYRRFHDAVAFALTHGITSVAREPI